MRHWRRALCGICCARSAFLLCVPYMKTPTILATLKGAMVAPGTSCPVDASQMPPPIQPPARMKPTMSPHHARRPSPLMTCPGAADEQIAVLPGLECDGPHPGVSRHIGGSDPVVAKGLDTRPGSVLSAAYPLSLDDAAPLVTMAAARLMSFPTACQSEERAK